MAPADLRRHQWVWLDQDWQNHLAPGLTALDGTAGTRGLERERPLVVARQSAEDGPDRIRLGLSLPGRHRIGLLLSRQAILRCADPPDLVLLADRLPPAWRDMAARLLELPCRIALFGGVVWDYFAADARLVYLTPDSDLDLLLRPVTWRQAENTLGQIRALAECRPRLDGEMVLPNGAAIAWREWLLSAHADLLVKFTDQVALRERGWIRGQFPP